MLILGNRILAVESRVVEEGHERRWNTVSMFRDGWQEYQELPADRCTVRVGRWFALGQRQASGKWRIQDGGWSVDVISDKKVAYEVADRIVLAIRRQALINRQAIDLVLGVASQNEVPKLDVSHVGSIRKDDDHSILRFVAPMAFDEMDNGRRYVVTYWTGEYSGEDLYVVLVGDDVELLVVAPFEI